MWHESHNAHQLYVYKTKLPFFEKNLSHLFSGADETDGAVEVFLVGKGEESGPKSMVDVRTNSCW